MARGEKNARRDDRAPFVDSFFAARPAGTNVFAGAVPGYSQPDAIDPTGYTLRDRELPGRIADGMIPDDVLAPLGVRSDQDTGSLTPGFADDLPTRGGMIDTETLLVGRVAPSSYGMTYGPVPGGALLDESREYAPSVYLGDPAGDPTTSAHLPPGWCARPEDLGMEPHAWPGEFIGLPHAIAAAPLEYQPRRGTVGSFGGLAGTVYGCLPEHLQSTIERGIDVYGGYQGLLNAGEHGGRGAYGGLYDEAFDDGYDQPAGRGGYDALGRGATGGPPLRRGGAFGPAAFSALPRPLYREVDAGDEYDVGVDPAEDPGWRRGRRTAPLEPGYLP